MEFNTKILYIDFSFAVPAILHIMVLLMGLAADAYQHSPHRDDIPFYIPFPIFHLIQQVVVFPTFLLVSYWKYCRRSMFTIPLDQVLADDIERYLVREYIGKSIAWNASVVWIPCWAFLDYRGPCSHSGTHFCSSYLSVPPSLAPGPLVTSDPTSSRIGGIAKLPGRTCYCCSKSSSNELCNR